MFRSTRYHKICNNCDLIYISELMLRWPFDCYTKICYELFHDRLKTYIVTEDHMTQDGLLKHVIMKFQPSNMTYDYIVKSFNSIAFKKENIEKIEEKKIEYTFIPEHSLVKNEYRLCTRNTIGKIAPQLAYAICLTAHKKHFKEFKVSNVLDAIYAESPDEIIYWGKDKKRDWKLTDEQLWSASRLAPPAPQSTKDLAPVENFIQKQQAQGIKDAKQLAKLVDTFFPGLLTDQELGELLPARSHRIIAYESQRKRGQRLRNVR